MHHNIHIFIYLDEKGIFEFFFIFLVIARRNTIVTVRDLHAIRKVSIFFNTRMFLGG